VFILEHYFAQFAVLRDAFNNTYPYMKVPTGNNISGNRKFLYVTSAHRARKFQFRAVLISSSVSAATTGYGCSNSTQPLASSFCASRCSCGAVRVAF
jgi:hypothetical protein